VIKSNLSDWMAALYSALYFTYQIYHRLKLVTNSYDNLLNLKLIYSKNE